MENSNTASRLKMIMSMCNIKQVDILRKAEPLCEKYNIKLNKNDLSQYVNGKTVPGQNKLFILALTLDVSEAWLMGYDVPMERNNGGVYANSGFNLSTHEKDLIIAYRSQPSLQLAVDRTLGISEEDQDSDKNKKRA